MSEAFRRCAPFSAAESAILVGILDHHLEAIESKRRDNASLARKVHAWEAVFRTFNAHPAVRQRSDSQLRRFWENRKAKQKRAMSVRGRGRGGGGVRVAAWSKQSLWEAASTNTPTFAHEAALNYRFEPDSTAADMSRSGCPTGCAEELHRLKVREALARAVAAEAERRAAEEAANWAQTERSIAAQRAQELHLLNTERLKLQLQLLQRQLR